MSNPNVPPDRPLRADDLRWDVPPVDRAEDVDVLLLDEDALLPHSGDMRVELKWVRRLLHEALHCIARLEAQVRRLTARLQDATSTILELRRQLQQRRSA